MFCSEMFCSEMEEFLVKKEVYLVKNGPFMLQIIRFKTIKTYKKREKKAIRNFRRQNGNFFPKKVIKKFWSAKFLPFSAYEKK